VAPDLSSEVTLTLKRFGQLFVIAWGASLILLALL
jgi:hypothetical protein